MSALAFGLVLASAFLHATWNLLAKRAAGGVGFLWLFSLVTVLVYLPVAVGYLWIARPSVTIAHVAMALGSGIIHMGYFGFLQRGYRAGDLSLVYPLARGSGPALATALAIVLLGERPGVQALAGTALVVVSVFVLSGGGRLGDRRHRTALGFGLLTGGFIAWYTVWDGYAVGTLGAVPLLYTVVSDVCRTLLLTPLALRRWDEVRTTWQRYRREALGVGVLSPFAYLLVLSALQYAPISLVAPTREVSILIAAVLGSRVLAEGRSRERAVAALAMVVGVALLALS